LHRWKVQNRERDGLPIAKRHGSNLVNKRLNSNGGLAVHPGSKIGGSSLPFPLERAKVAILGAGPTGLGAANRLHELGLSNFTVFEKEDRAGGLAASITDGNGFTWDIGGHVQFSHYAYFDDLLDDLLGSDWFYHQRESWVWMRNVFIPYPFQNNIRYLPQHEMEECLEGVKRAVGHTNGEPTNFEEWIYTHFGDGIARHFLLPYNFKVWAYPPQDLGFRWVGERVAPLDLNRILNNIREARDDVSWGPNHTFRYPMHGGTGETWRRLANRFAPAQMRFRKTLCQLDSRAKILRFSDGTSESYDILISSIPLDILIGLSDLQHMIPVVKRLRHSAVHVIGIGLRGTPPPHLKTKCWMYFPEDSSPYYRATVLSNYSCNVVPDPGKYWSLMVEISESPVKAVNHERILDSVINGMLATRLIDSQNDIVDTWHYVAQHGYPTPSLERDDVLEQVLPELADLQIFSRGRFGAWKYEVSNQDHSLMQGVELIDWLAGRGEEETLWAPDFVNARPKVAVAKGG
jgi:protoporphyrinogen oxidase